MLLFDVTKIPPPRKTTELEGVLRSEISRYNSLLATVRADLHHLLHARRGLGPLTARDEALALHIRHAQRPPHWPAPGGGSGGGGGGWGGDPATDPTTMDDDNDAAAGNHPSGPGATPGARQGLGAWLQSVQQGVAFVSAWADESDPSESNSDHSDPSESKSSSSSSSPSDPWLFPLAALFSPKALLVALLHRHPPLLLYDIPFYRLFNACCHSLLLYLLCVVNPFH